MLPIPRWNDDHYCENKTQTYLKEKRTLLDSAGVTHCKQKMSNSSSCSHVCTIVTSLQNQQYILQKTINNSISQYEASKHMINQTMCCLQWKCVEASKLTALKKNLYVCSDQMKSNLIHNDKEVYQIWWQIQKRI